MVAVYQDFRRPLLVFASPRARRVTFVDPRTRRVSWSLTGFGSPVRLEAVGGIRVYVVDEARNEIDVVDLELRRIVRRIRAGSRPLNVAFVPQGKMWVTYASRPARDVAVTRDGAVWLTRPDAHEIVRIDPSGRRTRIRLRADRVRADDTGEGRVLAADRAAGRADLLSPSGRVLARYGGCPGASDVTRVGGVSVDVACADANAVGVFMPAGGKVTLVPVGGAPSSIAVAVL